MGGKSIVSMRDREELKARLHQLREEHRDLDSVIDSLSRPTGFDQLRLTRLKKRKLALRDQIAQIESDLLPDIIA